MAYKDLVLADGATHYWRLNELTGTTAADAVGTAVGTISGGVTRGTPGAVVPADPAMTFDGTTGRIVTGSMALPLVCTIEVWLKIDASNVSVHLPMLSTRDPSATGDQLYFGTVYQPPPSPGVVYLANTAAPVVVVRGTTPLRTGQWHHVVAVFTPPLVTLYVDGRLENTFISPRTASSQGPCGIGCDPGSTLAAAGALDEVAIYPTALTAAQVSTHYRAASGGGPLWPAKTWAAREFVTSQMLNDVRDELNDLHARIAVDTLTYVDVPFAASNFFYPSSSSWTVTAAQVAFNRYLRVGKLVIWTIALTNTTVGGAVAPYLYCVPPLPIVRGFFNARATVDVTVGSSHANAWMWVDPNSGCVLFQAPSGYQVGTFTGSFTVIYETAAA